MGQKTIVVNDVAASHGGALTVLNGFYNAVMNHNDDAQWIFLLSERYFEDTEKIKIVLLPQVKNHFNRIVFDSFTGGRVINRFNPSVVFSLQNTIVSHCNGKRVTYIHQPLPFQKQKRYSFFKKDEFYLACVQYFLGMRIIKSIRKSDLNIVQTKWMKASVESICSVNGVKQIYPNNPVVPNKATYLTTNCFFYPTSNVSYKNNQLLINATKSLLKSGVDIKTKLTVDGSSDRGIEFLGRIPLDQVYEIYASSCLVFPSYIETFGYPLVEARSAGAIVLASDCDFSHELLDGYENAYYFDPFIGTELENLMKKVATGEIRRRETTNSEQVSNCENTWDQVIEELLKAASIE